MQGSFPVRQVLVYSSDPEFVRRQGELQKIPQPEFSAKVVGTISQTIHEMGRRDLDALVVQVNAPKHMVDILRIRRSAKRLPVLALIPDLTPSLEALARQSGADSVLRSSYDTGESLDLCARALGRIEDLIQRVRIAVEVNRAMLLQLQSEVSQLKPHLRTSFELASIRKQCFVPLLVEDALDQSLIMMKSFDYWGLPSPLSFVGDMNEAIGYLLGEGKYGDRVRFPMPTLVITDLHLPKGSGIELIQWIRSHPQFAHLIIFMLSSSASREDFDCALEAGADSYFMKPRNPEVLQEMLGVMAVRWNLLYPR